MKAFCWEVLEHQLYFGGTGAVYEANTGLDDDGADIDTDMKTAFSYFGRRGQLKRIAMVRPNLSVDGVIDVAMTVNVDFEDELPDETPSFTPGDGSVWDEAVWDEAEWAGAETVSQEWQSVSGIGDSAALRMKTASMNGTIRLNSINWKIEPSQSAAYI